MGRIKGAVPFQNNLESAATAPVDARMKVDLKSDLTNTATWNTASGSVAYRGMLVVVSGDSTENNGIYALTGGNDFTVEANWIKAGTGGGGGGGASVTVREVSDAGETFAEALVIAFPAPITPGTLFFYQNTLNVAESGLYVYLSGVETSPSSWEQTQPWSNTLHLLSISTPSSGQVWRYNGSQWAAASLSTADITDSTNKRFTTDAQQTALGTLAADLAAKAPLTSPNFGGVPTAPEPSGTPTNQIATVSYARNRSNHTGTQPSSSITNFASDVNGLIAAWVEVRKGQSEGIAPLDVNSKVPLENLPDAILGQLVYGGTFDAATAVATLTPNAQTKLGTGLASLTLTNNTADPTGYVKNVGIYYVATNLTAQTFAGISFIAGDWLISTGSAWAKVDNTDAVTSVNGQTGLVQINRYNETITIAVPVAGHYYLNLSANEEFFVKQIHARKATGSGNITVVPAINEVAVGTPLTFSANNSVQASGVYSSSNQVVAGNRLSVLVGGDLTDVTMLIVTIVTSYNN